MNRYRPPWSVIARPTPVKFGSSGAGWCSRPAAGIAHLAEHDDPLALRLPRVLRGEVGVLHADQVVAQQGPGHLGQPLREEHQRLLRVAERGRLVAG
jgi:hypothetical protein